MSSVSRVFSGSSAAWFSIFVNLGSQFLLVPIFLSHWEPKIYGVWLAILALFSLVTFIDSGHHNYLGYEFLRLGAKKNKDISKIYYSSIPIAIGLSVLELLIVFSLVYSNSHINIFRISGIKDPEIYMQAGFLLILHSILWLIIGNWSTIAGRVLAPFGYYPRIAWWQVLGAVMTSITSAFAVIMGGNLLIVGIAYQSAYAFYAIPVILDIRHKLKKEKILPVCPDYKVGMLNLQKSLAISFKSLLDMFRQQHIRLVIAPLAGVVQMVVFVTIRTCANVFLQGLGTITNPLLPELMHFLRQKDQDRSEVAISFVWFFLVAILVPSTILAQWIMPEIFSVWTRGKVEYNSILFAIFSLSVLVFALAQPAMAVVQGHNLLKSQVWISILATGTAIVGIFTLMPLIGITGAGVALLLSEILAAINYIRVARKWFYQNGMLWPQQAFFVSAMSVVLAGSAMTAIAIWPSLGYVTVSFSAILIVILIAIFWRVLPMVGQCRFKQLFS